MLESLRLRYARNLVTYAGALVTTVSSILFLSAMIGAVLLAKKERS